MTDVYVKFSYIVLCFIIALFSYWFCRSRKDWAFLAVAMGFTMMSDFFLLIVGNYTIGVFTFCLVHIAYIMRVSTLRQKRLEQILSIISGGGLAFFAFLFIPILPPVDPLLIIAFVYACLFVLNFICHIGYFREKGPGRKIMLAGLILFALCDIHVLMFNLHRFVSVPPEIALWGRMWIWVFYAPSQLLLAISGVKWKSQRA